MFLYEILTDDRFLILALLATSACAPVYVPNLRNSPMFTKGAEFQASVQIGNGLEVQSAFCVTEHFALMTNAAYIRQTDTEDQGDYHRHANNKLFAVFQAGASLGMSDHVYFDRRTFQLSGGLGLRLGGSKNWSAGCR